MLLPLIKHSFIFQNLSPSRDVQTTSRRWMFMNRLQLTSTPLYVSPFFSSTNALEFWAAFSSVIGSIIILPTTRPVANTEA